MDRHNPTQRPQQVTRRFRDLSRSVLREIAWLLGYIITLLLIIGTNALSSHFLKELAPNPFDQTIINWADVSTTILVTLVTLLFLLRALWQISTIERRDLEHAVRRDDPELFERLEANISDIFENEPPAHG